MTGALVGSQAILVEGSLLRIARLRDEPYECLTDPEDFLARLKRAGVRADLFTFSQEIADRVPRHPFHLEWDRHAVLTVTTHQDWLTRINRTARKKLRRAPRRGVEIRAVELDDDLVRAIASIYGERVLIQGKRNRHYAKSLDAMRLMLETFRDRSDFLGAYHGDELIGFVKLVRGNGVSSVMHSLSRPAHSDKAPTNALLGHAVAMCAERGMRYLHFGLWSRRGLGEFKRTLAFEPLDVPRYFVPLNRRGEWLLALTLHRRLRHRLPEAWLIRLAGVRDRWNAIRFRVPRS